jgi:hypothetical protein
VEAQQIKRCTNIYLNAVCSNPDFRLRILFIPIQLSVHIKGLQITEYAICRLDSRKLFQAETLDICTRMVSGSNISRGIDFPHLGSSFSQYLQENARIFP